MQIHVSARTIKFSDRCACCLEQADTELNATFTRQVSKNKTQSKGWGIPYCSKCVEHINAAQAQYTYAGLGGFLAFGVTLYFCGLGAIAAGLILGAILGFGAGVCVYFALEGWVSKKVSSRCACRGACVSYLGWDGSLHGFGFASKNYAKLFYALNHQKIKVMDNAARDFIKSELVKDAAAEEANQAKRKPRAKAQASEEEVERKELPDAEYSEAELQKALQELDALIGLDSVKAEIKKFVSFAQVQQMRKERGMKEIRVTLHAVYSGNPGTGKTTVARLIGRIYKALGLLKTDNLLECDRSALVGGYVGQTALKTTEVISKAMDGVLFIDEAYTLVKEKEDFGKEAIDTLLKHMEDSRGSFAVIVAGYSKEMERFVKSNPGLESRFTDFIHFPDYSAQDCARIFEAQAGNDQNVLSPELKSKLIAHYTLTLMAEPVHFANGRAVRNDYEDALNNHAMRISQVGNPTQDELCLLTAEDLKSPYDDSIQEFLTQGASYQFQCPGCSTAYLWEPVNQLEQIQCSSCNQVFKGDFGVFAIPH